MKISLNKCKFKLYVMYNVIQSLLQEFYSFMSHFSGWICSYSFPKFHVISTRQSFVVLMQIKQICWQIPHKNRAVPPTLCWPYSIQFCYLRVFFWKYIFSKKVMFLVCQVFHKSDINYPRGTLSTNVRFGKCVIWMIPDHKLMTKRQQGFCPP